MFFPISFERFIIEGIAAGEIKSNQIKFQDIEARYVSELEKWQTEKTPLKYPFFHLERMDSGTLNGTRIRQLRGFVHQQSFSEIIVLETQI